MIDHITVTRDVGICWLLCRSCRERKEFLQAHALILLVVYARIEIVFHELFNFNQGDEDAERDMGSKVYMLHLVVASLQPRLVLSVLKVWERSMCQLSYALSRGFGILRANICASFNTCRVSAVKFMIKISVS